MTIVYECNYCGAELVVTPRLVGERLTLLVTPCQHCIARKALLATNSEWARKNMEREAVA